MCDDRGLLLRRIRSWGPPLLLLLLLPMAGAIGLRPAEADGGKALDEYFRGTVVSLKDKVVCLRYDFRDKEQAKDFDDRVPWPIERRDSQGVKWFDEQLEVVGNSAARHVAEWTGDITVKVTITCDGEEDIGGFLTPINGAKDFATFTLVEKFFHAWDNSSGGTHSIIKFGNQWRERGSTNDFIGFRYVDRKPPKDDLKVGAVVPITFGIEKKKLVMTTPQVELKGKDRGKRLTKFFLGLYAIKGRALFDNVEICGTLNDAWLRAEGVDLRIASPVEAVTGALDADTQELISEHKGGKSSATRKLIRMVGDVGLPRALREQLVAALAAGPKSTVKYIRDLLYDPSEEIRADAIGIIKALLGKDWGYKASAKESKRSKAIQKMNDELKENPALLDG